MKIIRTSQLVEMTGLSRTTLWRLEKAGDLPARIQLSAKAVGYSLKEIEAWLEERAWHGRVSKNKQPIHSDH